MGHMIRQILRDEYGAINAILRTWVEDLDDLSQAEELAAPEPIEGLILAMDKLSWTLRELNEGWDEFTQELSRELRRVLFAVARLLARLGESITGCVVSCVPWKAASCREPP